MLNRLRGHCSHDLSIDLGPANTLIYMKSRECWLTTPSASCSKRTRRCVKVVLAVGADCKANSRRTPGHSTPTFVPADRMASVSDFTSPTNMLIITSSTSHGHRPFNVRVPRVLVFVPRLNPSRRRSIKASVRGCRPRALSIWPGGPPLEAMAGRRRCRLAGARSTGSMVLDIGVARSEVAIVSLTVLSTRRACAWGGYKFD